MSRWEKIKEDAIDVIAVLTVLLGAAVVGATMGLLAAVICGIV